MARARDPRLAPQSRDRFRTTAENPDRHSPAWDEVGGTVTNTVNSPKEAQE